MQILVSHLQGKHLLLLLDNCEHLLGAAAQRVADVLREAPNVRVIATSREPLQVRGEHVSPFRRSNCLQRMGANRSVGCAQNEAVMLFTERASAATGAFDLSGSNHAAVVALCRRVDGPPLAIELAAVRTRVLSVDQIVDRLADRFAVLAGTGRAALPRHQTLRATIDWSYDLLTAAEQVLFRRLCVFASRFTLEDVESICASDEVPPTAALDVLSSLVDKLLVMKEDVRNFACYRLHETMREYATLKLRDGQEERVLEELCLEHDRSRCLRSAEQARYHLVDWLEWAELEVDNIRAVLQQCLPHGDFVRGLDIAASMGYYWITHGTSESVQWLDQLLAAGEASPPTQVRAYHIRGWLSLLQGDAAAARPWIVRAVAAARETPRLPQLSESLSMAAIAESVAGDLEAARRYLDEAEAMTPGLHDFAATIELMQSRAVHAFFRGDLETAELRP
jgi:predicted ATPase